MTNGQKLNGPGCCRAGGRGKHCRIKRKYTTDIRRVE